MVKKIIGSGAVYMFPFIALAAAGTIDSILTTVESLLKTLIPIMITLAVVLFFWGLAMFIWGESGEGKEDGKKKMIWGLVALFVMVSVWGIVSVVSSTFGIEQKETITIPRVR